MSGGSCAGRGKSLTPEGVSYSGGDWRSSGLGLGLWRSGLRLELGFDGMLGLRGGAGLKAAATMGSRRE